MSENWNDYGNYAEEEIYRNKSFWGKLFSFRTLKTILKWLFYLIVIALFATIFFRMGTNKPEKNMTSLLCTPQIEKALSDGKVTVFSHPLDDYMPRGGEYAIFDVKIIAETEEVQFTVRYNNSTVKKLREQIASRKYESEAEKQAALDKISSRPFVFALRDEDGNLYTAYSYVEYSRTVYQYIKVSFAIPGLLSGDAVAPGLLYPNADAPSPLYIYKGEGAGKVTESATEKLSFEMYYENEALDDGKMIGKSIDVYKATKKISPYDYKKELDGGVPDSIKYISEK